MVMLSHAGAAVPSPQGYAPRRSLGGIGLVVALHLLLAWALFTGLAQRVVDVVRSPIEARLIEERRIAPPPPPPVLPPPTARPPTLVQVPVPEVTPLAPPPPPPLAVAPAPPPPPVAAPAPAPVAVALPSPAPLSAATAAAMSPEQVYAMRLLEYVNSIKRYPSSREARQLRPQGTVKIWLEIDRAGQLLESGVQASSGVLLLDQEALRTVRNGRYPAFAAQAFGDQPRHRFVVAMEYLRPGE